MCDKTTPEDQRAIEDWLKTHRPTKCKAGLAYGVPSRVTSQGDIAIWMTMIGRDNYWNQPFRRSV